MIKKIISIINFLLIIIFLSCEKDPSISNCTTDFCGVCDNDPSNDCIRDCNGIPGGNSFEDCNGNCGGTDILDCLGSCISKNSNDNSYSGDFANMDCNGDCNGSAIIDNCGICSGGNTGIQPNINLECGCYGKPQLAKDGEAQNAGFILLGTDNDYFANNGCASEIHSYSSQGYDITTPCGLLSDLRITNEIYNAQNIIFYEKITAEYSVPYEFTYYQKDCTEDDLDIIDACNLTIEDGYAGTIYINQFGEILYNTNLNNITNFKFTLNQESCIERSNECDLINQDFTDSICQGPLHDSDLDGISDSNCECFKELDESQTYPCCCGQTRGCDNICGSGLAVGGCDNTCGSTLEFDECGVCGGAGIPQGNCDCSGNVEDCAGVCGGTAANDNCGTCDSNSSNDCLNDCNGIPGGSAVEDDCGVCEGDNSSCLDCLGIPNGDAVFDGCGVCDGDNSSCISNPCDLPINSGYDGTLYLDPNNGSSVWYNTNFDITGFQWNLVGGTASSASGGDAQNASFVVSTGGNTIIGFSFTGSNIPTGCGVLTNLNTTGNITSFENFAITNLQLQPQSIEYYSP